MVKKEERVMDKEVCGQTTTEKAGTKTTIFTDTIGKK